MTKTANDKEQWHHVVTPDGRLLWMGWGIEKNRQLMETRQLSFEMVLIAVAESGLVLARDERPAHKDRQQWLLEVTLNGYTHICPCKIEVHDEPAIFLKTCYPSRKANRRPGRG